MDPLTGYLSGRIIPARAGFTVRRRSAPPEHWDHPRSRGVYSSLLARSSPASGSSPLARGLPPPCTNPRSPRRDHPRSRGVYDDRHVSHRLLTGSSPLARGLPGQVGPECPDSGIIPARAGFTYSASASGSPRTDHPRSRGVYICVLEERAGDAGSSPLARGLLVISMAGSFLSGIIPARAGFTQASLGAGQPSADHPRSRGVYFVLAWDRSSADGIIPARAGFTSLAPSAP